MAAIGGMSKGKKPMQGISNPPAAPPRNISQMTKPPSSPTQSGGGTRQMSSMGGGGGGYDGGYSGGGGGLMSSSVGTMAPAMPAMPTDEEWLAGDTSYQAQVAALQKALTDYQAGDTQQRSRYEADFGQNQTNLGRAKTEGLSGLDNDFGARGMLQSGMYAEGRQKMEGDFQRRGDELMNGRTRFLSDRDQALGNFQTEQNLTKQQALADALARRAAQYGGGFL